MTVRTHIEHVVVAGAGTMGVTLARLFAQAGSRVTLWNRRQPSLDRAQERIAADLDALAAAGRLDEPPAAVRGRIALTTDRAVFETADFVVENIAEDLAVKRDFFADVSARVGADVVLATNTSGLRVSDVATAVQGPERFCGMHWWNPPDLIPLVEITKGDRTADEAARLVHRLAADLGKRPVIVQKDILGIIGNRLQYAVLREALHIIALGAAGPEEVDAAMKFGPGFRWSLLGPLETADLGGVDIFQAVSEYLFPDLADDRHSEVLARLVAQGRCGLKTGAGEAKRRWRDEMLQKQWDLHR